MPISPHLSLRAMSRPIALFALLLAGCLGDPERGNPLDPLSDNFSDVGAVAGTVTSFFPPFQGLGGVRVGLTPLAGGVELVAITDAAGRFSINNASMGSYLVSAELSGYTVVVDTVNVEIGQLAELTLPINGIPTIQATTIHSENLNRWFPQDPLFQLVVEAIVDDPDGLGDIEDVRLVIPSLGYSDTLRVVVGKPGVYRRIFSENELPVSAQDLLGLPLQLEATDAQGVNGSTNPVQIVRIIASFPQGVEPNKGDVLGPQPTFVWQMFDLPFSFTQQIDIAFVPVPGQEIPLLRYSEIAPTDTTFTIPDALQEGVHGWTVSAVDAFGNLSRSRPRSFTVALSL